MNAFAAGIGETGQARLLLRYRQELADELQSILAYWAGNTVDEQQGGFYASIGNNNIPDRTAPKGVVLNSRILWTFSAGYRFTGDRSHHLLATRAFEYIIDHFTDAEHGGVFWSVDHRGKMQEGRKQVYGLAFCIYGLAEYYKATTNETALDVARQLFALIEQHSHDKEKGGYIEAFTREWQAIPDLRLSEKDENERKTMNTHLHIVEAYAGLYRVWPDESLRERIIGLLKIFDTYIIDQKNHHLHLFMDDNWTVKSSLQSFGHDIEAAWLLQECAEIIDWKEYTGHFKKLAIQLADAALEGWDDDGGLWYEYEPRSSHWIKEKHSWPQAEAMIGFFNAWQLTGDEKYLHYSVRSWDFVKRYLKDNLHGEWYWGVYGDHSLMDKEKAGFWKCPYHNSRACMEVIRRINF
jgi:cellobiose epimerase